MPVTDVARRVRVSTRLAQTSLMASAVGLTTAAVLVLRAVFDIFMESATFDGLAGMAVALPVLGFVLALAARQVGQGRGEAEFFFRLAFRFALVGMLLIVMPVVLAAVTPDPPVTILAI